MAFVTCGQFKTSQEEQNAKISELSQALSGERSRLQDDLTARLKELNNKLNNLKDVEIALNAAKTEGNYNKIKELEAQLQKAKEAQAAGDKGLADAIEALRKQGLSDADIQKIIDDAIAKAGGNGRYITQIVPNQDDGTVTYYYSDGTIATGKLANFGGVVVDNKTMVGNGNEQALSVQLSKQPGNMLEARDDGLYYGQSAKADLVNLYVANHGDDNNIGTREKPLRTIQAAIDRTDNQQVIYTIWLHENHHFDWVYASRSNASYDFRTYGDIVDAQYPYAVPLNAYYRGHCAASYPRATINVRVEHRFDRIIRQFLHARSINFAGINLNVYNKFEGKDSKDISGSFTGIVSCLDSTDVSGCILTQKTKAVPLTDAGAYRDDVIFHAPIIRWIDSKIEGEPPLFASSSYTNQISVMLWNSGQLKGYGQAPNHESLIPSGSYETAARGIASHVQGVIINDNDKYVLGINFNYDVFTIK